MAVISVNKNDFSAEVLESTQTVVVDFWAEWCGPCKMIAPLLNEISEELVDEVKILKVNVDENPELAAQYGVRSLPTLLAFKGGAVVENMTGAVPKSRLMEWVKAVL